MIKPIISFGKILRWRSRQPAVVPWLGVLALFGAALLARVGLGRLHGANPILAFYPAILVTSVLFGWRKALALLMFGVAAGVYLFLPPGLYLQPIGWMIVGSLNIIIIAMLESVAQELMIANERQRLLFQELQHRVANTLQGAGGILEVARRRLESSPAEAAKLLEGAAQRIAQSADVHRRLNDPTLFLKGLGTILQVAVSSIIEPNPVALSFDVEELDLSFDQMTTIAMLVIEIANNAQKHVFQHGWGSIFSVTLQAVPHGRAMLVVRDDGPGVGESLDADGNNQRLGFRILQGLTDQLFGHLTVTPGPGTEIVVQFPLKSA